MTITNPQQRDARWYAEGLRFECTGCGRCCSGQGGYVWVSIDEIRRLAARAGLALDEFGRRFLRRVGERYALVEGARGDCVFLGGADGKSCQVYEDRPAQCRAYPWWPAHLRSPDDWQRTAAFCEGIRDDAPLHEVADIEVAAATARAAGLSEAAHYEAEGMLDEAERAACEAADASDAPERRGR